MIAARRLQRSFGDGLIAEEVADLWEPWMRQADQVLEDDGLVTLIQQELSKRCKKSKTRGRPSTPADVVLRLALLKHMRNWSFAVLAREVRANLVYREFTRIGGGKVPDDKTMGRLTRQLSPAVVQQIHARVVAIAREEKVVEGRKMRVDTTVASDTKLLIPSIETHEQKLGRPPRLAAADAGFYSHKNETEAQEKGVQRVSIPNRSTKSPERKREQKKRWFRNGQKWRTGSEGRISVLKRRHRLNRSRYKGDDGMKRWAGLGVIARSE